MIEAIRMKATWSTLRPKIDSSVWLVAFFNDNAGSRERKQNLINMFVSGTRRE
jgi:hypothetical protein